MKIDKHDAFLLGFLVGAMIFSVVIGFTIERISEDCIEEKGIKHSKLINNEKNTFS